MARAARSNRPHGGSHRRAFLGALAALTLPSTGLPLAVARSSTGASVSDAPLSVNADTNLIVDGYGRVRLFHGVNAVEKEAPYLPVRQEFNTANSLSETDAQMLQSWGFNMVRLGVMWPAVMPEQGVVNTTYLDSVVEMVRMLDTYGIASLIDLHQDVLSPYLCGEGMPDWVFERALELVGFNTSQSPAFPAPLPYDIPTDEATGKPDLDACQNHSFFTYYMSFESEAVWHALYSQPEIWEMMADHWAAVAEHLRGEPGVLGYEMLNEPWSSRGFNDSWHVLSDSHTVLPLYQTLHDRIRSIDQDTLFFFEPLVLESYESVVHRYSDFPQGGPGGIDYANRSVFAYHSYCASAPDGAPSPMPLCRLLVRSAWTGVSTDLANLGVGGFLTEFGAVGEDTDSLELIRLQTEGADKLFQGWSYWTYKSFDDITTQNAATETFFHEDGTLQTAKIKALARSYAPIIAGTPVAMSFDSATSDFSLEYTVDAAVTNSTSEVFLHTGFYYPQGYQVSLTPETGVSWQATSVAGNWTTISVTHDTSSLSTGQSVTVSVTAAS